MTTMKAIKNNILVGGVVSILLIALLFQPIKKSLRGYSVITVYSLGQMHDGTWTLPLNRTRYRIYENQNKVLCQQIKFS